MSVIESFGFYPGKTVGEVGRGADEDASLNHIRNKILVGADDGMKSEGTDKSKGQNNKSFRIGSGLPAKREITDDRIHRERGGEIEESREDREENKDIDIPALFVEKADETPLRFRFGLMLAVVMVVCLAFRGFSGRQCRTGSVHRAF